MSPAENAEVSLHERKKITVNDHALFIDSLLSPADHDELDDMIVVDPYECHAPSRRSDKELGSFLALIDSLPTGNDRKETTR